MKLDLSLCESASTTLKQKVKRFIPAVSGSVGLLAFPEGGAVESYVKR